MEGQLLYQVAGTDDSATSVENLRFTHVLKEGVKEITIGNPPEDDKDVVAIEITWGSTGAVTFCLDPWKDDWSQETKTLAHHC